MIIIQIEWKDDLVVCFMKDSVREIKIIYYLINEI